MQLLRSNLMKVDSRYKGLQQQLDGWSPTYKEDGVEIANSGYMGLENSLLDAQKTEADLLEKHNKLRTLFDGVNCNELIGRVGQELSNIVINEAAARHTPVTIARLKQIVTDYLEKYKRDNDYSAQAAQYAAYNNAAIGIFADYKEKMEIPVANRNC